MSAERIGELVATKGVAVVRTLAKKFAGRNDLGLDEADFISLGQQILVEVAPEYDELKPVQFTTYIFPYINGAMQDALRRKRNERSVQGFIEQEVARDARQFASRQSDDFEIVFDTPEVARGRCDATLSELAVTLSITAAAATVRLSRQGTEDHLGELDAHGLLVETVARTVASLAPPLQRLWVVHYVEGQALKAYAVGEGISDATAGRYHATLKEKLRDALLAVGIDAMPDVE
jgi:DNA-directed RNA polymerase specialized sigma subunit